MRRALLLPLLGAPLGCGNDFVGEYTGAGTEGGSVKIFVEANNTRATNESAPRRQPDQKLGVTAKGDVITVTFTPFEGSPCALEGKQTSGGTALVKGTCPVKIVSWQGDLPLSGTLSRKGAKGMGLEVVGNHENAGTNVSYTYSFTGERK